MMTAGSTTVVCGTAGTLDEVCSVDCTVACSVTADVLSGARR